MDVLTPTGFKDIKNLRVGEVIYGADGGLQHIVEIAPRNNVRVFEIRTTDGSTAIVGGEYLLNLRTVNGNGFFAGFRNFPIETLNGKDLTRLPPSVLISGRKPKPRYEVRIAEQIDFLERQFDIHPYVLGVLIGDGSLHDANYVSFSNPDFDSGIARKVERLIPDSYYLKKDNSSDCTRYLIALRQKGAKNCGYYRRVKALNLNVLSRDKFIPKEYLIGSRAQRLELLRGLMDTDGTAKNNRVSFSTTSPRLVDDFIFLVRSLGGICHQSCHCREGRRPEYQIRLRMQECPFSLDRKAAEWNPPTMKRHLLSSIKEINGVSDLPHITVSNLDGLFITNNYITIHI